MVADATGHRWPEPENQGREKRAVVLMLQDTAGHSQRTREGGRERWSVDTAKEGGREQWC